MKNSSTKILLLEYTEGDTSWVWNAKRKTELDAWPGRIIVFAKYEILEKEWRLESESQRQTSDNEKYCWLQWSSNDFEVVAPGKYPGLLVIETLGEDSTIREFRESHHFVYYPAVVNMAPAGTPYMEEMNILPLSMFSVTGTCSMESLSRTVPTEYVITFTSFQATCSFQLE